MREKRMPPALRESKTSGRVSRTHSFCIRLAVLLFLLSPLPSFTAPARWFLIVDSQPHALRVARQGDHLFLHLGDLARAVGGEWGREPQSSAYLLTVQGNRVRFRPGKRRMVINGRRQSLARPLLRGEAGLFVPDEFIPQVLAGLVAETLKLEQRGLLNSLPGESAAGRNEGGPDEAIGDGDGAGSADRSREGIPLHVIVLDPGHGGQEEGGRGPTGLLEKDVTLDVARRLRIRLQRRGYKVVLTREGDVDVPLDERTALANNSKADLFLSLHVNASPSHQASGAETYYLSLDRAAQDGLERKQRMERENDSGDDLKMILWDMAQASHLKASSILAELIQGDFNVLLQMPDRGVKQAPLRVLVGARMPAVLVEIGFISNPEEELRLQDPVFLQQLVNSLDESIEAYRFRAPGAALRKETPREEGAFRDRP